MQTIVEIPVKELRGDPNQPRKSWNPRELQRLADSIKALGVKTPLTVMKAKDGPGHVVVTGESRLKAAEIANLETVPCLVLDGVPSEEILLGDRIAENNVRCDIAATDLARALLQLKRKRGATATALSKELGLSKSELSKLESLLSLPEVVQSYVDSGRLAVSTAYILTRLDDPAEQRALAEAVVGDGLTRKEVIEAVAARAGGKEARPKDWQSTFAIGGMRLSLTTGTTPDTEALFAVAKRFYNELFKARKENRTIADLAALFPST